MDLGRRGDVRLIFQPTEPIQTADGNITLRVLLPFGLNVTRGELTKEAKNISSLKKNRSSES